MVSDTRGSGGTILTLGILGLVCCGLLSPFAWTMGNSALEAIDSGENPDMSERGLIVAGRACGIVGTILLLLGICFFLMRSCAVQSANDMSGTSIGHTQLTREEEQEYNQNPSAFMSTFCSEHPDACR